VTLGHAVKLYCPFDTEGVGVTLGQFRLLAPSPFRVGFQLGSMRAFAVVKCPRSSSCWELNRVSRPLPTAAARFRVVGMLDARSPILMFSSGSRWCHCH